MKCPVCGNKKVLMTCLALERNDENAADCSSLFSYGGCGWHGKVYELIEDEELPTDGMICLIEYNGGVYYEVSEYIGKDIIRTPKFSKQTYTYVPSGFSNKLPKKYEKYKVINRTELPVNITFE